MRRRAFLVFSGYNMRAVVAFCRFAEARGIPVCIVATGAGDPIRRTAYARWVVAERASARLDADELGQIFAAVRRQYDLDGLDLLPSSEYLNRFFLQRRTQFERLGVTVPLCEQALYECISDKSSFCELCAGAGLDVPRELSADETPTFPLVIKPRCYADEGGQVQTKPILVFDERQYVEACRRTDGQDVFLQEYVHGDSYYLHFYIAPSGDHVGFSQRNLIQQAHGGSIVAALPATLHHERLAAEYRNLLVSQGFAGLVMIELRCAGDRTVMIEANPRLWGPSQLFVDCGVPLFERFVVDLGYAPREVPDRAGDSTGIRYFWAGGLASDLSGGRTPAYHGYSQEDFAREFGDWLRHDVLLRPDTFQYFHDELHDD